LWRKPQLGVVACQFSAVYFCQTQPKPMPSNEQLHNKPILKQIRKDLRNNLTPAEAELWKHLKNSGLEGRKFRRQHSVGFYVLDFYCPQEQLAVELDGQGHFTSSGQEYDSERTAYTNYNHYIVQSIPSKT